MAESQQPTQDMGSPRLPLLAAPDNRDGSTGKDARLVNGYVEKTVFGKIWVCKRPGLHLVDDVTGGAATGRGVFRWYGSLYSIFGTTLYKDGVAVSGTLDATGGVYSFGSCLGATPKLIMQNGVKAYTYDTTGGLVQITDADFPGTELVKGVAYLDGTNYVMNDSASVKGSDFNDPTSWNALNSIVAQIEPDAGIAIAKQLVYVIALKQWSTEVFYDAGNATGSPLGNVQGAKIAIGCASADSVQEMDGALFWIGCTHTGSLGVYAMESLKVQEISTPAVTRILQDGDFTTVYSWTAKINGHSFYGITLKNSNVTMVFDVVSKEWAQWTDGSGNYFPICASTVGTNQRSLLQHETNGKVYDLFITQMTDDGVQIPFILITPVYDGGTRKRKFLAAMDIIADKIPGCVIQMAHTDDDYQTWSNYRQVDLEASRPRLIGCGTFRRRAYKIWHTENTQLRIQALELQIALGTL